MCPYYTRPRDFHDSFTNFDKTLPALAFLLARDHINLTSYSFPNSTLNAEKCLFQGLTENLHFTCVEYGSDSTIFMGTNNGRVSAWDSRNNSCYMHWEADTTEIGEQGLEAQTFEIVFGALCLAPNCGGDGISWLWAASSLERAPLLWPRTQNPFRMGKHVHF